MPKPIYLDYAAATPLDKRVLEAMRPYYSEKFYNPSATYLAARGVRDDLESARAVIAGRLGSRPSEIIFTAGGTEANNMAISGVMRAYPNSSLVISAIEHDSVIQPAANYSHKLAPVSAGGFVDVANLGKIIDDNTVLVSIMLANNEIGTIQPLREVARLLNIIRKKRAQKGVELPLYLHTDACQAAAYLDLHVSRLGVDLMTINGGKIYGPKQSGVLYVKTGVKLEPIISGGGQENGYRSGTENVSSDIGLAEALDIVQSRRMEETIRLAALQKLFFKLLDKQIPDCIVNGSITNRLPNNIHITLPGYDNERIIMELDQKGILCAEGSACSASSEEPSHVLKAIGLSDGDAQSSLRFTMGIQTTEAEVEFVVEALATCL